MAQSKWRARCPACSREFREEMSGRPQTVICPYCEAEVGESAFQDEQQLAEELAPGIRPGDRLGNYEVKALLGSGGMAVVFSGVQLSLNRPVAIKVLPRQYMKKRIFLERFESEAAVLASLNHPNIVSVIDRGESEGTYFIVMEFIEGATLKERLNSERPMKQADCLNIAEQVLAGLEYAHERGVVHRDIKPGNIMINEYGTVKIADFGLAHLAKRRGGLDITRDNQSMGTMKYMAPEQLTSARNVDGRADIYSLGVVIYEMLTGQLPLGTFKMPSEAQPELDVRWDDLITRALRMDPEERFSSAAEMAAAVHEIATGKLITASDREAEEEGQAIESVEAALTVCSQCGHESPPDRKTCENCGAALSDLFEPCPSCGVENRIDIQLCPECGEDLEAHRTRYRLQAEEIQRKAKKLAADKNFDRAIQELDKLMGFRTREYAGVRRSAELWIERIRNKKERFLRQAYEAGIRMVAEKRYDRALQLWQSLPDDYLDIRQRRALVESQRQQARKALALGQQAYASKQFSEAIENFERALKFWPHKKEIHDLLQKCRDKQGNLNLKAAYLREANAALKKGRLEEASDLCRKVLDLDSEDSTALELQEAVERRVRSGGDSDLYAPDIILPERAGYRKKTPIGAGMIVGGIAVVGVIILLVVLLGVLFPAVQGQSRIEANKLFADAREAFRQGDMVAAARYAEQVREKYPSEDAAFKAGQLLKRIAELRSRSGDALREVNRVLSGGDDLATLTQAYDMLRSLLNDEAVKSIPADLEYAESRFKEVRRSISKAYLDKGEQCEAVGDWRQALAHYETAREKFACYNDSISAALQEARQRVSECARLVERGRAAFEEGALDQALGFCRGALDSVPADTGASRLLAQLGQKLPPPEGMVYIPAGTYRIGGAVGHPLRTAALPHGLYMDESEVTAAEYGEYLQAVDAPVPAAWEPDGRPPEAARNLPMVGVTLNEARAYAAWRGKTIPTEPQWEAAASGLQHRRFPWGNSFEPVSVLGYGPVPEMIQTDDIAPYGCLHMGGNVAEWTVTEVERGGGDDRGFSEFGSAHPTPVSAVYVVVKGSSWAGCEAGRPTRVVPLERSGFGPGEADKARGEGFRQVLTWDPEAPLVTTRWLRDVEVDYLGAEPTDDWVKVHVRKWDDSWRAWIETQFSIQAGDPVRTDARVPVVLDPGGAVTSERRAIETGYVVVRHEPNAWVELKNPYGVIDRLEKTQRARPGPVTPHHQGAEAVTAAQSLEQVTECVARMVAPSDARFENVGFRCVQMLWTPPVSPE